MHQHLSYFSSCALIAILSVPTVAVRAQETATEERKPAIEELVVSGVRLPTPAARTGTSISVLDQTDLEQLGTPFLNDALITLPGITMTQNGGFGGFSGVRIRGALSEQTLVLVDGVPVNDTSSPGGGFDFARFDPALVSRVEVLRGAQSTLWGSDAIGGVVSITTRGPEEGLGGSAFAEAGSFNTFRGGAEGHVGGDAGDLRLGVTGITSDGISRADKRDGNTEKDGYESLNLTARGGLNLPGDVRLSGGLVYTDSDTEFDSFGFATGVVDGDESSKVEEINGHVKLDVPLLDDRFANSILVGYSDLERTNFTNGVQGFQGQGRRWIARYQGTALISDAATLAFGAETEETRREGETAGIDSLFALAELEPVERLTVSGGVRLDDHSVFGSVTTFRATAAFEATEMLILRGNWGEGFKAPTLFQTTFFCCGASAPNADLVPERSDGWEVGADLRLDAADATFSLTWFDQSSSNLIDFSFAAGGYENIAQVDREGLEVAGEIALADWFDLSANYTRLSVQDGDGQRRVRVPKHSGAVIATFRPMDRLTTTLQGRFNSSEIDSRGTVAGWVRVDLSAQYRLNDQWEVFGRIENLLDEQYQQVFGFGTPGISAYLGVRVRS